MRAGRRSGLVRDAGWVLRGRAEFASLTQEAAEASDSVRCPIHTLNGVSRFIRLVSVRAYVHGSRSRGVGAAVAAIVASRV